MALEDVVQKVTVDNKQAKQAFNDLGLVGAKAFADIINAAASGDFSAILSVFGPEGKLAASILNAASAVQRFVAAQADASTALTSLAAAGQTSVTNLEGLQSAFASAGIGAQGFDRSMGILATRIANAWAEIQQSGRTAADEENSAQLGMQSAALATSKAYRDLQDTMTSLAQTAIHDQQSIKDASLGLQHALLAQQKSQGSDTSADDKALGQQEAINNVIKARQSLEDANIKAAQDEAKAFDTLKEAQLAVAKAQQAEIEAAEHAYEIHLKNIPEIARELKSVADGTSSWKEHLDLTAVSGQNLANAIIKASSVGGQQPGIDAVLETTAKLFSKTGEQAVDMGTKVEIVQKLFGAGFRPGLASAAQLIQILSKGPEELNKFRQEAEDFSKTPLGFKKEDQTALDNFSTALSELGAVFDQIKEHIGAMIGAGMTEWLKELKADLENPASQLSGFIQALIKTGQAIGELISIGFKFSELYYKFFEHIGEAIGKVIELYREFKSLFSSTPPTPPPPPPGGDNTQGHWRGGLIDGYAGGGSVRGPGTGTSDSILARLSHGEFVMKDAAVRNYGVEFMDAINNLRLPGFAAGGPVHATATAAAGGNIRSGSTFTLQIEGHEFKNLRAPADTADRMKTYAITRQTAQTGVKPSWVR
jgi:hypothetical protein